MSSPAAASGATGAAHAALPRLDFHVKVPHRLVHACKVVRKARASGKTVLVYSSDADRLARFDTALWTFSPLDFLPHVDRGSPLAIRTPVWLSQEQGATGRDVLLLLDDDLAENFAAWFACFERVIEVVSGDETEAAGARARYRAYRSAGFQPETHEVGG